MRAFILRASSRTTSSTTLHGHHTSIMDKLPHSQGAKSQGYVRCITANSSVPPSLHPSFQPSQWAFGCIKGLVKKKGCSALWFGRCIWRSLQRSVTAFKAMGWLKEVGRNVELTPANTKQELRLRERERCQSLSRDQRRRRSRRGSRGGRGKGG